MCELVRDLDSRRLDLWEDREQLDEGPVQATCLVGSGCVQEGKRRQIFEGQSDQDLARDRGEGSRRGTGKTNLFLQCGFQGEELGLEM